jgi:hypothetical protein
LVDSLYELGFINENLHPKQLRIVAEYFGELIQLEATSATNAALKVQELKQRYPKAFISKKKVKPEVGEK